jgi:glycerophosphoryl diester phosphodiesterase
MLLGHRGARGVKGIRENTLQAFDLALAQGCDGFEFDVRLSADGQAVICHDAEIRRREIAGCSAQSLQLPLLAEVLTRYREKAFLDIELKVPGLEAVTLDLLRKHRPTRGFVVSSFLPDVLRTIHNRNTILPLGLICETRAQLSRWAELTVEYVIPHFSLLLPSLIAEIRAAQKKILVWTVNAPAQMQRFAEWGVDGIISDHPERLVRALRPKAGSARQNRPRL